MTMLAAAGALGLLPLQAGGLTADEPAAEPQPSEPVSAESTVDPPAAPPETSVAPPQPDAPAPAASAAEHDPAAAMAAQWTTTAAPTVVTDGSPTAATAAAPAAPTASVPSVTETSAVPTDPVVGTDESLVLTADHEVAAADDDLILTGGVLRQLRFPVLGPVSYHDDFAACRDGCARKHAGGDLIGLRLQPIIAAANGVIHHLVDDHPTAGWGVVIEDAEGWQYRYYHLNNDNPGTDDGLGDATWRFAPGVAPGATVMAGQVIGWMGDSGNSEQSVPHLHFELRQPDGRAVNPFPSLRWAQRVQHCQAPSGQLAGALVPLPEPAHELALAVPGGTLLLDRLGLAFPTGRAWVVGDARFTDLDGPCPAPGAPIDPPVAPPVVTDPAVFTGG